MEKSDPALKVPVDRLKFHFPTYYDYLKQKCITTYFPFQGKEDADSDNKVQLIPPPPKKHFA